MAIHDDEQQQQKPNTGTGNNTGGNPSRGPEALNFGTASTLLLNPNNIDAKISKLANDLKIVFDNAGIKNVTVSIFSNILTVSLESDHKVLYYIIVPSTSSTELTVSSFIDSIMNNINPILAVDIVSPDMYTYIVDQLKVIYAGKNIQHFKSLDGLVLPHNVDTTDQSVISAVAGTSFMICNTEASILSGRARDLSVKESADKTKGITKLRQYSITQDTLDYFGRPTRTEFGVELSAPQTQGFKSILSANEVIVTTNGFINILPKNYQVQYPGAMPVEKVGFMANIVINMMDQPTPTLGYAFLGIATTAILARSYNWVQPVSANADNVGYLNKLVNLNPDKPGAPAKSIDFNKLKMNSTEKNNIIVGLIDKGVTLSVDIPILDNKITTMTPIAVAAVSADPKAVSNAKADIINTLNLITGNEFGRYFKGDIFDNKGIVLPQGEFSTDKGQVSIDHIDAPYIMKHYGNNYMDLLSNLMFSELGYNGNPFLERIKFLHKVGIDAKITGKKIRATFSTDFVEALLLSFAACGLNPQYDSVSVINKQTGLDFTANYFQHSDLGNLPQFGHQMQTGQNGYRYDTNYNSNIYR